MIRRKFLAFITIFSLILAGCQIETKTQPNPKMTVKFFSDQYFRRSLSQLNENTLPPNRPVVGGVLPHDIFPGFMPARFFSFLSKNPPKTIVIIGPNHYERGVGKVITSTSRWETPFGVLEPDLEIINRLTRQRLAQDNPIVVVEDHATTSVMPYFSYFLPETKVVPLMLSASLTRDEIESLASILRSETERDVVILAAVDFSHYLRSDIAEEKDDQTLRIIKARDIRQLLTYGNDHLDSPPSIALLMLVVGNRDPLVLDHTNSGKIQNNEFMETTSYFSILYPK